MSRFIPVDKMKKLRDASRSGDERAKKILSMQLDGKEDFSSLMDEYFKPQTQVEEYSNNLDKNTDEKLEKFLKFNGIDKDNPEYDSYVEDYYKENPKQNDLEHKEQENCNDENHCFLDRLIKEEVDAIRSYSDAIMEAMSCDNFSETELRGITTRLEEIKRDETEHFEELRRLKASLMKKNQKEEGIIE